MRKINLEEILVKIIEEGYKTIGNIESLNTSTQTEDSNKYVYSVLHYIHCASATNKKLEITHVGRVESRR